MKILVSLGTYERVVYGVDFDLETSNAEDIKCISSKDSFAVPAHIASVRSVASCKKYLVSGSTDETIKIFDLKKKKDIGSVVEHSGSINSLDFFGTSHLLTGSEDGKLALFRTSDWECLHIFAHKTPVSSAAVHPSGKLAISVSPKDKSLKIWNLVTGKPAGKAKTLFPVDRVIWSPSGSHFALQSERAVLVYAAAQTKEPVATYQPSTTRILNTVFADEETVFMAGEGSKLYIGKDGNIREVDLEQKPRIKDMNIVRTANKDILVTIASDGSLCLWSAQQLLDNTKEVKPIVKHTISGLRPICMTSTIQ